MLGPFAKYIKSLKSLTGSQTLPSSNDLTWLTVDLVNDRIIALAAKGLENEKQLVSFTSNDGLIFTFDKKILLKDSSLLNKISNVRFFQYNNESYLTLLSNKHDKKQLIVAKLDKFGNFEIFNQVQWHGESGVIVSNFKYQDNYLFYYGGTKINLGYSSDLNSWYTPDDYLSEQSSKTFNIIACQLVDRGIFIVYDTSQKQENGYLLEYHGILFSQTNPNQVLWRSEVPLGQKLVEGPKNFKPIGAIFSEEEILTYWLSDSNELLLTRVPHPFKNSPLSVPQILLKKYHRNPILSPNPDNSWESEGTFNPAALYGDGKVHLVYRAVGANGMSMLGYASSTNGFDIDQRSPEPIYFPREEFEGGVSKVHKGKMTPYFSGGSWGGCEDPKLTLLGDRVYMTYVAHNGYNLPRVALTSIKDQDFFNHHWDWERPILISSPEMINKSGCLLPEKINQQYVFFHRIFPDILIDYVTDLEFKNGNWLTGQYKISPRLSHWDSRKLSVGATPLKTKLGWLVIYHAVDDRDPSRYKIGAMILDQDNPTKVLYRTPYPILMPDEPYENEGKAGVAYPCGAVVLKGNLFVYYGGGDKVVCVATIPLNRFLHYLVNHGQDTPSSSAIDYISWNNLN